MQRIPAENINVVSFDQLVAEFLHLNRRLGVTFCPQELHTFSEDGNSRMLRSSNSCCCQNEVIKGFHKPNWIRHAVAHKCREHISSIQADISALFDSRIHIQAVCPQVWKKAVSVRLGRGNDSRVPGLESSPDELRHIF